MNGRAASRQLPLTLDHRPQLSRDDLVVTPSNAAAVAMIDRWPHWPGSLAVLVGPAGSGKSHLAAIWRSTSQAAVLAPDAIEENLPAMAHPTALVDAADGGELDETGLFHLINLVKQGRGHLLLTARSRPSAWNVRLPDLASRLKAASLVELGEPDDLLLAGVITKLFADRQIEVEPQVVQYLVLRMERSLSAAIDLVGRLDEAALVKKGPITRALAAQVLSEGGFGAE